MTVCSHCRSLLIRKDLDIESLGKVAQLQPDGSPLRLYAEGRWLGERFTLIGRLQLRYEQGFWSEWHLRFDDERTGWLGDAQGTYTLTFKASPRPLPARNALRVGAALELDGARYTVRDLREAEYYSAEGELPFRVALGRRQPFADLSGPNKRFATVDYSEDPPILFMGEYAPFESFSFTGLREIEGW